MVTPMMFRLIFVCLIFASPAYADDARTIGQVSTAFTWIGPNHKVVVTAFDDPKVEGITCYVARPKTGGIKGGLGLAEDPSVASVACVQTGAVRYRDAIEDDEQGEQVFDERRSLIFKSLEIIRLYDAHNGSLVYFVRTHRVIEGSPETSISVVTPIPWNGVAPEPARLRSKE
jgi:CreA protein